MGERGGRGLTNCEWTEAGDVDAPTRSEVDLPVGARGFVEGVESFLTGGEPLVASSLSGVKKEAKTSLMRDLRCLPRRLARR